jgi:putative transcriptional regulator
MDELGIKIAGEISCSSSPGGSMRKWREIFGIKQSELANHMGISVSTISDYESNRRASPGVAVIKRFVTTLLTVDKNKGNNVAQKLRGDEKVTSIYRIHEFLYPIPLVEFCENIEADIIFNSNLAVEKKIHGYTIVDSLRAIMELSNEEFHKIYGQSSERAIIFTKVSMGRSPLVAIRVTSLKPSIVILHGINATEVDKLALKIAEVEKIPIAVTEMKIEEIEKNLKGFE